MKLFDAEIKFAENSGAPALPRSLCCFPALCSRFPFAQG